MRAQPERKRTSFKGRVMALPEGWPTGTWICAAARLAKRVAMAALANMLRIGIMRLNRGSEI